MTVTATRPQEPVPLPSPVWRFVPSGLDAGDVTALEPLFQALLDRPLATAADLERWLLDESELLARVAATLARRYVASSRRTDDEAARAAYLAMERDVMPRVKTLGDALDKKFLHSPALRRLDGDRYGVVIRRRRTQSEIFREVNTALQVEESELQTRQQAIVGAIGVDFEGKRHTVQQMAPWFENQDRGVRERAWRATLAARQASWGELEDVFDKLLALRTRIGRNAGFPDYTSYRFLDLGRYDYTAATCRDFHRAVEECVVPAVRALDEARRQRLGVASLRPWDLEVDLDGRPPHRPFADEAGLIDVCRRLFARVDPVFAGQFDALVARDLLDLMSRPGKAPGGYQYQLEDERVPFIFANSVGLHGDVQTLLHEGGHAFHSLACRGFDLLAFRDYPIEMAETASMSMELLGLEHLGTVYAPADARAAYVKKLEGVLRTLTWIATIDAFQHWLYAHPDHDRAARRTAWLGLMDRFDGAVDWQGLEEARAMRWIGQHHLFTHPHYYVEYGIAQIAALQVWNNYRRDPAAAVAAYRRALALGGSRPLPELFAAANVRFDLSPALLRELVTAVTARLRG